MRNQNRSTRQQDERLLAMLHFRTSGYTTPDIGAHYGMTCAAVRVATNRVVQHDAEHSGAHVLDDYWPSAQAPGNSPAAI